MNNLERSKMKKIFLFLLLFMSFTPLAMAGRGCCSHHGGVCGCQSGQVLCCDGTLSPSCGCYKFDKKKYTKV